MRTLALLCVLPLGGCGCETPPVENALVIEGVLERAGTLDDNTTVDVAYGSKNARAEWWSCELRVTATACVDDAHVNVYVTMPAVDDFDALGQPGCADAEGNAFGAFEMLTERSSSGEPPKIPGDARVLVLVASDVDGDGAAALEVDDETKAASLLASGNITVNKLGEFDDPVALTIDGKTTAGNDVHIELDAPSSPVTDPPPLEEARTCVDGDALE